MIFIAMTDNRVVDVVRRSETYLVTQIRDNISITVHRTKIVEYSCPIWTNDEIGATLSDVDVMHLKPSNISESQVRHPEHSKRHY